ncbi:MAG: type I-G CRISPR-associated helicase/endonuclease Cas3g [Nocardioides sp.]
MRPEDFADFYHEVHAHQPFPWQRDLVQQVVARHSWPSVVNVPTGLGKTAMIDIAVFLAALDADAIPDARVGRRRIFFVVDRRIVVDQAEAHARKVAHALGSAAEGGVVAEVAARLRVLGAADTDPLPVVKMRGGATWDAAWLPRPDLPGIVTGTVDQVGSRLLFRGYGVSRRRWPIDAALVGTDSLILVDEAHLATALTTTLDSALSCDAPTEPFTLPPPVVVQLSATVSVPTSGWAAGFDVDAHLADPEAARRLRATKTLRVETVAKPAAVKTIASLALAATDTATNSATSTGAARVLVVCNTIDRARAVHGELARKLPQGCHLSLLFGRSREFDRERVVQDVLERFRADRDAQGSAPAVLVATQTVEVGIDIDATDLVTESSSWDALVQRIGRVNRRGVRERASCVVVHDQDPKNPVYGEVRDRTVGFLRALLDESEGSLDISPLALRRIARAEKQAESLVRAPTAVPLLLPAHLDAWARTAPAPSNDAPLDAYLHGIDSGVAAVTLTWRDGLWDAHGEELSETEAALSVDALPIRMEEAVEVPVGAVRRWLSHEKAQPLGEWDDEDDWDVPFGTNVAQRVLRRATESDGSERWRWADARELRPGDSIVVPAELGGLDAFGWAPDSKDKVIDVSELAAYVRARPVLRLDDGLPARLGLAPPGGGLWDDVWRWRTTDDAELAGKIERRICVWLTEPEWVRSSAWARADRLSGLAAVMGHASLRRPATKATARSTHEQLMLVPPALMCPQLERNEWRDVHEEADSGTAHFNHPVTLREHHAAVGARARLIAQVLNLPEHLADAVEDAAKWHDLGKVDERFQAMLFGGDEILASLAEEPRAKSGMAAGDRRAHREAHRRSGMPQGARHEAWSAALVEAYVDARETSYAGDPELLVHLVASHHGHARPLLPIVVDNGQHELVTEVDGLRVSAVLPRVVDLSAAERFEALNRRYGRWGLAMLETIVRSADMTVSAEGS